MSKISYFTALVGSLVLLNVQSLFAQNPSTYYVETPRTFIGGLVAGANFTQVDGDRYAGYHKVGINFGGVMYMNLADHLAASVEILYSQKGSRAHTSMESADGSFLINKYNIKLNYAEVPIQLNYFDRRRSHFGAGFSISRLISVDENGTSSQPVPTNFEEYQFRKMDYNFIAGGSLHLWKGLFLNARFQYSLVSIRDKDKMPPGWSGRTQQFNNMWTVRMMYLF